MPLDQVDRSAQLNRPSTTRGSGDAALVAAGGVGQAEGELEPLRVHSAPSSASFSSQILRSCVIAAISSRHTRSIAGLSRSYSRRHFLDRPRRALLRARQRVERQRQQAIGLQPAQRRRLDTVEQIAARQRVELLQRRRLFERGRADTPPPSGTGTGRTRIRCSAVSEYGRAPAAAPQGPARWSRADSHEAVGRLPLLRCQRSQRDGQRSLQLGAQLVEIARAALYALRARRQQRRPWSPGRARSRRWPSPGRAAPATPALTPPDSERTIANLCGRRNAHLRWRA